MGERAKRAKRVAAEVRRVRSLTLAGLPIRRNLYTNAALAELGVTPGRTPSRTLGGILPEVFSQRQKTKRGILIFTDDEEGAKRTFFARVRARSPQRAQTCIRWHFQYVYDWNAAHPGVTPYPLNWTCVRSMAAAQHVWSEYLDYKERGMIPPQIYVD